MGAADQSHPTLCGRTQAASGGLRDWGCASFVVPWTLRRLMLPLGLA